MSTPTATEAMETVSMHEIEAEGAITVAVWLYGVNNGAWEPYGIDLSVEIAAFGKFIRQVSADLAEIGGISVPATISFINSGEDLTFLGTKLNNYNRMFAAADSDIETVEDLAGKRLAVPPTSTTTTNSVKAMVQSQTGFNIMEDTASTRTSAPPTLLPLLEGGDVDAVLLFSGDTVSATASPDYKAIFDSFEFWKDATGFPPPVANWTTKRSWLEENAGVAVRFLKGWQDAVEMFNNNIDEAITNYGRLGSVSSEEEAAVVKEFVSQDKVTGPLDYNQELADNNWELIEAMAEFGTSYTELPDKDATLTTTQELEEMAGM